MTARKKPEDDGTVEVTWAHHHEWPSKPDPESKPVAPGDKSTMDRETARGYATAGMLTIDPEDQAAMADLAGTVPPAGVEPPASSGGTASGS